MPRAIAILSTPGGAAAVSLLAIINLVALKVTVGLIIGSISVLSDALDSGMDLLGALFAWMAVSFAARPADRDHPYGHGKIESVSGIVEAALIIVAAGFITFEAIRRLGGDHEVSNIELGIAATAVSLVVNVAVAFHLRRVARRTASPALEAAARHRMSDIVTSVGVLTGLVLIGVTPWTFLDSAVALGVAAVITWTGRNLFLSAYHDLIDTRLSNDEEAAIRGVLDEHAGAFISYSGMRTRRSGRSRLVDLNLMVPRVESVARAHDLGDSIEAGIHEALPGSIVTIHIDPCDTPRDRCDAECPAAALPLCRATQPTGERT